MARFWDVDSGTVKLEGQSLLDIPFHKMQDIRGSRVSMIFQDALSSLNPVLTICDQISEPLRIHQHLSKKAAREKALEMLRLVGIPAPEKRLDQYPHELSGGMRQRCALIRTLASDPEILLLDEPFSALDYQTRLTVSADIAAMIRKAEKSVILITHDLAEAISLADRVLILSARPARVKAEFPIHLTAADHSPLAARRAPEYGQLFNQIWEELSNENN